MITGKVFLLNPISRVGGNVYEGRFFWNYQTGWITITEDDGQQVRIPPSNIKYILEF